MDRNQDKQVDDVHEPIPAGHHYAAPEVEEWKPHPYGHEGVGRKESLKAELPEQQRAQDDDDKKD